MDAASEDESIGAEQGLYPHTANSLSTPHQVLLWRKAVVVANDDPAPSASLDKIFSCSIELSADLRHGAHLRASCDRTVVAGNDHLKQCPRIGVA